MKNNTTQPSGKLILRTLAMPADTNPVGDIFGGWIMAQMDIAGGIMAHEISCSRVVTVAAETIVFIKPVHVGDAVACYGEIVKIGTTSITIGLEVWVRPVVEHPTDSAVELLVTKAAFTYVSVDEKGNKQPIGKNCCP